MFTHIAHFSVWLTSTTRWVTSRSFLRNVFPFKTSWCCVQARSAAVRRVSGVLGPRDRLYEPRLLSGQLATAEKPLP